MNKINKSSGNFIMLKAIKNINYGIYKFISMTKDFHAIEL